jgi:hypothetical protein
VITGEVQTQENRHGLPRTGRQIEQDLHLRAVLLLREVDHHLLADGAAAERLLVDLGQLERHSLWPRRTAPVDVGPKQFEDFGPPPGVPGARVADRLAAGENQRVGQNVVRNFGLVVVDVGALREGGRGREKQRKHETKSEH